MREKTEGKQAMEKMKTKNSKAGGGRRYGQHS